MIRKTIAATLMAGACVAAAATVQAESHADPAIAAAVKARQAQMQLYAFNLGQLGAIAKGAVEYDAEVAKAAADNLAALTKLNQSTLWPMGSDSESFEGSRALPALWENIPDVVSKGQAMAAAADAMAAAAGTDLASLQAQMGAVGGACGACHKAYRMPED